jgi:ubiquinone/menaquinone biosynthesis C-methylase UbiE
MGSQILEITQSKRDEISFFDSVLNGQKYDEFEEHFYKEIFDLLKVSAGKSKVLLDVGCGSGAWGIRLAKKGYDVVGVDISKALIKSARDWANAADVNFMPILGDVERLPLRTEAFDIGFCGYVLHHFKRLHQILFELSRILKPQGKILAIEPNGSNIVNKLARRTMTVFPQQWVMKKGIATSNERVHEIKSYFNAFNKTGFAYVQFLTINRTKNFTQLRFNLIDCLKFGRELLFEVCHHITPGIIGETELLMQVYKQRY